MPPNRVGNAVDEGRAEQEVMHGVWACTAVGARVHSFKPPNLVEVHQALHNVLIKPMEKLLLALGRMSPRMERSSVVMQLALP